MNEPQSQATKLVKHSTIYAIGNISRQLVSFIMLPIYTRYLTPSDYGVVGLISFAIAMFETLLGAKMVQALPKFYHDQTTEADKNAVISTAFMITGFVSAFTVLAIFLFRAPMSQLLFSTDNFALIVGLCALQMLTQALEYYALMYIRLLNRPITFVIVNISKLFVQLSLNIWLVVVMKLGVMGVAISGVAASTLYAVGLSAWALHSTGIKFNKDLAKRMILFSWPLWLSGLASLYIYSSNRYYIRIFDSLNNVGLYELAAKFSGILTLLVWSPFSQYWQTEQFKIVQRPDAKIIFSSIFRFISCFLILVGLGISIFSDSVIRIMAAPEFRGAAYAVPFLLGMSILASLTELANVSFLAKEETSWLSKNNYLIAIIVTALYCALTPWFGYVGAAAALAIAQLIQFLTVHYAARRRAAFYSPLLPLVQMAIIAIVGYLLSNCIFNQENIWLDLAIKSVVFIIAASALLLVLWSDLNSRARLQTLYAGTIGRFISVRRN